MEISNETKARIFAQYYPCKYIGAWDNKVRDLRLDAIDTIIGSKVGGAAILLKPLSSITDEDAIEVYRITQNRILDKDVNNFLVDRKLNLIQVVYLNTPNDYLIIDYTNINLRRYFYDGTKEAELDWQKYNFFHGYQYLQSKGYALPYLGYSVEDLVEAGIYKLM